MIFGQFSIPSGVSKITLGRHFGSKRASVSNGGESRKPFLSRSGRNLGSKAVLGAIFVDFGEVFDGFLMNFGPMSVICV